jgi:hypothetical protein
MNTVKAHFTEDQVKSLIEYQKFGLPHEFNCRKDHAGERALIPTKDGWICPTCDYKQDWCFEFMFDIEIIKENFNKFLNNEKTSI